MVVNIGVTSGSVLDLQHPTENGMLIAITQERDSPWRRLRTQPENGTPHD